MHAPGGSRAARARTAVQPRCALLEGFSLHANTHLPANDRQGLEQLCCYSFDGRTFDSVGGSMAWAVVPGSFMASCCGPGL